MDAPKRPHQESTTYAANFLQSEMFQLEHSINSPPRFDPRTQQTFPTKKHPEKTQGASTILVEQLSLYPPFFSSSFFFCSGVFGAGSFFGGGAGFAAGGGG
jgi:hypothetical protein